MQQQVSATSVCHSEKESCRDNPTEAGLPSLQCPNTNSYFKIVTNDTAPFFSFRDSWSEILRERTVNRFECSIVTLFFFFFCGTTSYIWSAYSKGRKHLYLKSKENTAMQSSIRLSTVSKVSECTHTHTHTHTDTHRHTLTANKHLDVVFHRECVCTGFCMGLLSCMLNWKQVQRKDLITFAAHYPVTVCTYLPLCVLINQAQTTLSAPLHFSTWLATSNSRAQQPDETTCCCLLFQHLQCKCS